MLHAFKCLVQKYVYLLRLDFAQNASHPQIHSSSCLVCVFSLYVCRDACDLRKYDTSTQTESGIIFLDSPRYATIHFLPCVHTVCVSLKPFQ